MRIYIPFMFFKKYKSGISFVSKINKQTFYSIFHNRIFTLSSKQKLKEGEGKIKKCSKVSQQYCFK